MKDTKLNHYWNLLRGKTNAKKAAKLTWKNIKAVSQAWLRHKQRTIAGFDLEEHIWEQIVWRRVQVKEKSPECWDSGYCIICGCEILGKTMEDRECSNSEIGEEPCYPEMMDKETWQQYKINNQIKIFS